MVAANMIAKLVARNPVNMMEIAPRMAMLITVSCNAFVDGSPTLAATPSSRAAGNSDQCQTIIPREHPLATKMAMKAENAPI